MDTPTIASVLSELKNGTSIVSTLEQLQKLTDSAQAVNTIVKEGGISILVGLFTSPSVEESIKFSIFSNFLCKIAHANADYNGKIGRENGAIKTIIQLLKTLPVEKRVTVLVGLAVFGTNDANNEMIGREGGIKPIYDMFTIALEPAVLVLEILAKNENNQVRIIKEGGVKPLLELLNSGEIQTKEHVPSILYELAKHTEAQRVIGREGGIKILVELLTTGEGGMKEKVAGVLQNISVEPSNQEIIGKERGIKPLVESLSSEVGHTSAYSAAALSSLATIEEYCSEIVREGGIKQLLKLLATRKSEQEKYFSCATLQNLSQFHNNLIAKEGGIKLLVEVLSTGPFVVRPLAATVITNIAIVSSELQKEIAEAGAIKPLINLLSSQASFDAVKYSLGALNNLAMNYENIETISNEGGVPALMEIMKNRMFGEELRERAVGLATRLSVIPNNKILIGNEEGKTALRDILKNGTHAAKAIAAQILSDLPDDDPDFMKKCKVCKKAEPKRCSTCKSVAYCSVACQRTDWPIHKNVCKKAE